MVKAKICGSRPSKNNPNVYTRPELNAMALEKGMTSSEIKKLKKQELCEKLKIAWVASKKSSNSPNIRIGNKLCSSYKKDELVSLAVKKLKYTKDEAKNKTMRELCKDLSGTDITPKRKKTTSSEVKIPSPVPSKKTTTALHSYQQKIVDYLLDDNHRGAIAAFSTGSGKTLTAIALIDELMKTKNYDNIIILTPVKQNFENDMIKYGLSEKIMKKVTIMTSAKFRGSYPQGLIKCNSKTILIIDEVHNLRTKIERNREGEVKKWDGSVRKGKKYYTETIAALRCSSKVSKILLLTATPVFNNEYDTVNLITMIKGENGGKPIGPQRFKAILFDERLFNQFFSCVFLFHETKHSNKDFPSKQEHDIKIEMTPYIFKEYVKIYEKEEKLVAGVESSPFFYSAVRRAANALLDPSGNKLQKIYPLKCIWILDKIQKNLKQKTVIYSTFIAFGIEILQNALSKDNIPFQEIKGDINQSERKKIVQSFNTDGPNILFITAAGCEGLDLQGVRNIIIYESGWNRKSELQIIGRGVRYKSHTHLPENQRHVDIYHLLLVTPDKDPVSGKSHDIHSADEVLKELSINKEKRLEKFEERLKKISLGTKHCGD
jgi:superfamily II DNA or RNA helicase